MPTVMALGAARVFHANTTAHRFTLPTAFVPSRFCALTHAARSLFFLVREQGKPCPSAVPTAGSFLALRHILCPCSARIVPSHALATHAAQNCCVARPTPIPHTHKQTPLALGKTSGRPLTRGARRKAQLVRLSSSCSASALFPFSPRPKPVPTESSQASLSCVSPLGARVAPLGVDRTPTPPSQSRVSSVVPPVRRNFRSLSTLRVSHESVHFDPISVVGDALADLLADPAPVGEMPITNFHTRASSRE
ncbi:hypothetical protein, conserved in T. vivax [Trypanosoma vivax Y486]|uniref:Uncharacterized protein n=1 Tax=Trypanosoma vivax (strain Y486) TaxID=1055687 RepID=F9WMC7_TRYVY|nr:hypothetical protein, conserved in T. vivax [Trypanosoma vivax Y486]|eukprot:CCD18680.1 hypothetical protein, conserved in T. vivax [Trypanosoma vivax Y486]